MFRNILILVFSLFSIHSSMAQQPGKGTFTSEAQIGMFFSGFGSFIQNQIQVRHYLDSNWAVFAGPEFTINSFNRTIFERPDGTGSKGTYYSSNKNVWLNLGVLKFFRVNNNLAPFVGLQYGLGNQSYQIKTEDCNSSANFQLNFDYEMLNVSRQHQLVALTGADYWFDKGFYAGFQLAITGQYVRTISAKTTTNDNGFVDVKKQPPFSSYFLNSASSSGFRIGWRFN